MYGKIFIIFLLLALINFLFGCYSLEQITVHEYKQVEEEEGKPNEIYIKTKDNQEYHFSESNFYIENDTLYGKEILLLSEEELPFEGKFALGEIESIKFKVVRQNYSSIITVPVSQLFALRGCLWRHQTWLHPFDPFIAISVAIAVMMIFDRIKKINFKLAVVTCLLILGIFTGYCIAGTNYYYDIRWQPEQKIDMFKMLNQQIPPDKYLLSFEDFIVNQHSSKGGFYRPEIAWYLDREITQAQTLPDIGKYAAAGQYPYYLIPNLPQLRQLISPLMQRYSYQFIPSVQGRKTKDGKFLRAGMYPYLIFDLKSKKEG